MDDDPHCRTYGFTDNAGQTVLNGAPRHSQPRDFATLPKNGREMAQPNCIKAVGYISVLRAPRQA